MFSKNRHFAPNLERISSNVVRILDNLILKSTDANFILAGLEEVRQLFDSMLLGTADYGLAILRIDNATRFVKSSEIGAAKYEIRMLRGGLKQQLKTISLKSVPDRIVLPESKFMGFDRSKWKRKLVFAPRKLGFAPPNVEK